MLVLLSPAKTLTPSSPHLTEFELALTSPTYLHEAEAIAARLATWSRSQTQKELALSDALTESVYAWHQTWSPTSWFAAGWTFRGDAFKSLDIQSFNLDEVHDAQKRLRILHGVYGTLRPLDQYNPIRLEMSQRWCHDANHASMASFWKERLPEVVLKEAKALPSGKILNLASAEYCDVALHGIAPERIVTCQFLESRAGKRKSISAFAKAARGAMARFVLQNDIQRSEDLEAFADRGYTFLPEESSSSNKVFARTLAS
jgi:cytoplasmic iron level regulating protein YaaA (DUF328/UPF0246 family)